MPKFFLAIYLLLILSGCSIRESAVPAPNHGYRYFVNKVVFIDESTAGIISIPEACEYQFSRQRELMSLNIPQTEWHNYMKMNKWCSSLFNGQPDSTTYSLRDSSDKKLCNSEGGCIVKPEIYLKENNVFQVSFCDSKYYTQMRYDSLNVLKDFVGENAAWKPLSSSPYDMIVSDSLIVLRSQREYADEVLFYIEKKEWCKDCPLGRDVSVYVWLPFGYINSAVCTQKRDVFSRKK